MPSRSIVTEADRALLILWLKALPLPFTVDVAKGRRRSPQQNRLQRQWMNEISEQMGDRTPEEARAYCKLHFGVPILRAENTAFCERYDAVVKPLPYESKLAIMAEPLDLPVTRLFTTEQKTRYLDAIYKHFSEQGIVLTQPEEHGRAA